MLNGDPRRLDTRSIYINKYGDIKDEIKFCMVYTYLFTGPFHGKDVWKRT